MSMRPLLALSALCAIGAGLLLVAADAQHLAPTFANDEVPFSQTVQEPIWAAHAATHIVALFLFLLAVPGLYLAQIHKLRAGGLFAFAFLLVAIGAHLGSAFILGIAARDVRPELLDAPAAGPMMIVFFAGPLVMIASLVFAFTSLRTGVLPRWATLAFAAGALLEIASEVVQIPLTGAVVKGVALAGLGVGLWKLRVQAKTPVLDTSAPA